MYCNRERAEIVVAVSTFGFGYRFRSFGASSRVGFPCPDLPVARTFLDRLSTSFSRRQIYTEHTYLLPNILGISRLLPFLEGLWLV